jgi:hypothetical protein
MWFTKLNISHGLSVHMNTYIHKKFICTLKPREILLVIELRKICAKIAFL